MLLSRAFALLQHAHAERGLVDARKGRDLLEREGGGDIGLWGWNRIGGIVLSVLLIGLSSLNVNHEAPSS